MNDIDEEKLSSDIENSNDENKIVTSESNKSEKTTKKPIVKNKINPALVVSVLALIFSVVFGIYSQKKLIIQHNESKISTSLDELNTALETLVDLRLTTVDIYSMNDKMTAIKDVLINTKRQIYIEKIKSKISEIESLQGKIPINSYLLIGYESYIDGDFKNANLFYKKAIEISKENQNLSNVAYRSIASFYMNNRNIYYNKELAEENWNNSISLFSGKSDDFSLFSNAHTYLIWANEEKMYGNETKAEQLYDKAEELYISMNDYNESKYIGLDNVKKNREYDISNRNIGIERLLEGKWSIHYLNTDTIGECIFTIDPNNNVYMNVSIFYNNILKGQMQGQVFNIGHNKLQVNWQGQYKNIDGFIQMNSGIFYLEYEDDSERFIGFHHEINQVPQKFILKQK